MTNLDPKHSGAGPLADYSVGQHVQTKDGFPGVITEIAEGPGDLTTYWLDLDNGMGGGEYAEAEIWPMSQQIASRFDASMPIVAAEEMASFDYPELSSILSDRPPPKTAGRQDTWQAYSAERDEMVEHLALHLPMVPSDQQRSSTNSMTPQEKQGYDEGFSQGQEGITRQPSQPQDPEYTSGFEIGWSEGILIRRQPADSWADRELEDDQTAGIGTDTTMPMSPIASKSAGIFDDALTDWAKDKGPGFSFDWCRYRRQNHCWLSKTLDEAGSKEAGYAVWIPHDRGLCPRQKWDEQEACPVGQPGPHVPGGYTDASKPWNEGGQRGGVPGPDYANPSATASVDLGIPQVRAGITDTAQPVSGIVREFALTPTGTDFFADEADDLSRSYRDMPIFDPEAVSLWQELGELCVAQAEQLKSRYEIIRCDNYDPYSTAEEMYRDVDAGTYRVTSLHSHHPVWDIDTNVAFRVVHDLTGHTLSHSDFSFKGEVIAYQNQCTSTPSHLWPVLFTEIVAQSAYVTTHHLFGEQKVGLIPLTQDEIDAHVGKIMDEPDAAYDALHQSASLRVHEGFTEVYSHEAHFGSLRPVNDDQGVLVAISVCDTKGEEVGVAFSRASGIQMLFDGAVSESVQHEGNLQVISTWRDVQAKAKRIRSEGGVRLIAHHAHASVAHVKGDHGVYETEVNRVPGRDQIGAWHCGCKWSSYSWGRSGPWKKFEGRMCSHALALSYEVQARGMFGRELSLDEKQPAWMDQKHVHRPGDYDKSQKRYTHLASKTDVFFGKVRNVLRKLVIGDDGHVHDADTGEHIDHTQVVHPNFDPRAGLIAVKHAVEMPGDVTVTTQGGLLLNISFSGRVSYEATLQAKTQDQRLAGTLKVWAGDEVPTVDNVFVPDSYRHQGVATALWNRAKQVWPDLSHSGRLTPDGLAWSQVTAADKPDAPEVSGVVLKAADTGRILLLQRSYGDEDDPARGQWEAPGGHHEDGDTTSLHAAIREWQEEVGQPFPEGGVVSGTWTSSDGIYQGHVVVIPEEKSVVLHEGRSESNPDDPDGDDSEQVAWWEISHAQKNPALRSEFKRTPWDMLKKATKQAQWVTRDDILSGRPLDLVVTDLDGSQQSLAEWVRSAGITQDIARDMLERHDDLSGPFVRGFVDSAIQTDSDAMAMGLQDDATEAREDLGLPSLESSVQTGVYYHVSAYRNWPSIRDSGIRPTGGMDYTWVWNSPDQAVHYSDSYGNPDAPPCIVVVRTDRAVLDSSGVWGDMAWHVHGGVTKGEVYDVIRPEDLHFYDHRNASGDGPGNGEIQSQPKEGTMRSGDDEFGFMFDAAASDLHDEPEAALPSTDGDGDDWVTDQLRDEVDDERYRDWYDNAPTTAAAHLAAAMGRPQVAPQPVQHQARQVESEDAKGIRLLAYADALARGEQPEGPNPFEHLAGVEVDQEMAASAQNYLSRQALKDYSLVERQQIIDEGEQEGVTASNLDRLDIKGTHYEALESISAQASAVPEDEDMWMLSGDPNIGQD